MRCRAGGCAIGLAVLTAGCTTQSVTLLPGEGDHPVGALAVLNEDGSERGLLDRGNRRADLRTRGARARTVSQRVIDKRYGKLVGDLPPPAVRFVLNVDIGGARPLPDQEAELQEILRTVAGRPGAEVEVIGHTDTLDTTEINDELSRRRAEDVRRYLIDRGLAPDQVRASWRGEHDLAVATGDGVADDANRRVEVIVR